MPQEETDVKLTGCILAVAVATAAAGAFAQGGTTEADLGRSLAATCANCHGTNGKAVSGSTVAALAGRPKEELVRLMSEFRDGKRPATIMHQLAKGYTPAQVETVAAWFAAQK
jgi:sulfide dehydrogenase cytochrome subunit